MKFSGLTITGSFGNQVPYLSYNRPQDCVDGPDRR